MAVTWVRVVAATVPGTIHLRAGKPNQDAVGWLPVSGEGERVVMAVSDGHGAASPRSHLGSRIAVDVATRVLWDIPAPVTPDALASAITTIVMRWNEEVREHLDRSPLTPSELDQMDRRGGHESRRLVKERSTIAYGATLLFALVTSDSLALGQLGDGDLLLVSADGSVRRPLPKDERLVAHTTTSLCDDDPVASMRTALLPADTGLIMLATDGYANSFVDEAGFLQVGEDLWRTVERSGIGSVRQSLPQWLTETTTQGAGDDISVALAVLERSKPSGIPPRERKPPPEIRQRTNAPPSSPRAAPASLTPTSKRPQRPPEGDFPRSSVRLLTIVLAVSALLVASLAIVFVTRVDRSKPPAPSQPIWTLAENHQTFTRSTGDSVTRFELPSEVRNWFQASGGIIFLLKDGQVGRLANQGNAMPPTWRGDPTVFAIKRLGSNYVLVNSVGTPRWKVDPNTGAVTRLEPTEPPTNTVPLQDYDEPRRQPNPP